MSENQRDHDKMQTHVPLMKGTMVGQYRVVERIGTVGTGQVYQVEVKVA